MKEMDTAEEIRGGLRAKQTIVIKIGSSSLTHKESGRLDLIKLEILVRELSDLRNQGKNVILVSSGAVMVGRNTLGINHKPDTISAKQACASVGQAKLMMIYQKLFSEYNQICSQVLLTKNTMVDNLNRHNARNTFKELLSLGVIPIVNENDTIATYELDSLSVFGDNDRLSAVVAALVGADLLILLSDIDGLYTDDPHRNPRAKLIHTVEHLDQHTMSMGKSSTGSNAGTGGMATKLAAAEIASGAGCDMIIASGDDFHVIHRLIEGSPEGTLFLPETRDEFFLINYLEHMD
ncbi:MAG: glutamate 5-kinase [Eubacterium sp.]|nr:glutamate 5-kinase [Eubacterium sp.]